MARNSKSIGRKRAKSNKKRSTSSSINGVKTKELLDHPAGFPSLSVRKANLLEYQRFVISDSVKRTFLSQSNASSTNLSSDKTLKSATF